MNLNETPSGDRIQIGLFGKRNVGKSSLFNGIVNQPLAVVANQLGTTTDPVKKAMELLPLGPVVIWDTPGFDDEGEIGEKRVEKTENALQKVDLALVVVDSTTGVGPLEQTLLEKIKKQNIPYLIVFNKADLGVCDVAKKQAAEKCSISVCANSKEDMNRLREKIASLPIQIKKEINMLDGIVEPLQQVVLVIPIDESAPKGRLILPQQQILRELLEIGAIGIVLKETELEHMLQTWEKKPDLVITDSQAFEMVSGIVPTEIPLTSFSILMARKKGFLKTAVQGVEALSKLQDGDKILISEGCTHHRQCKDIGTVKLPNWIQAYTKKQLQFEFSSGGEFPKNLSDYQLVVHCGGCTLNEKEMQRRMKQAEEAGIPFTNYGITIASINGILERSVACIPEVCYNH